MMGCTDRHCRFLFRLLAPHAVLYSEMVVTGALLHGNAAKKLQHRDDAPCAVQLGGSNPRDLATAAQLIEQAGYQEVNLNCGCPSDRVRVGGIGACLMADPALVADCYTAMAEVVDIPVSIKSRVGIDDRDSYACFEDFVGTIYGAGCRVFLVHARPAWLTGLSPKENREIPPLRYDYVSRAKSAFPDAVFILNGGIRTLGDSRRLRGRYDGIMLGRSPYAAPYLMAQLERDLFGLDLPGRDSIFRQYREYTRDELSRGTSLAQTAKHLFGLYAGVPGARKFRRCLSEGIHTKTAGIEVLDRARDAIRQND